MKKNAALAPLASASIFRGISAKQESALAAISVVRGFRRDEIIFHQGSPSVGFYVIDSGEVNVHRLSRDGTERVIRVFRAGEILRRLPCSQEGCIRPAPAP